MCANKRVVLSNCLATTHPELAKEWHPILNKKTAYQIISGTNKIYWWVCSVDKKHEWQARPINRVKGSSCPYCPEKIRRKKSLAEKNPELAKERHPTKNGELTPFDVTIGVRGQKIWWKCEKGEDHEWSAPIRNRHFNGAGCPICAGKQVVPSVSLRKLYPEISDEWHPIKNGELKPINISVGSKKKVW